MAFPAGAAAVAGFAGVMAAAGAWAGAAAGAAAVAGLAGAGVAVVCPKDAADAAIKVAAIKVILNNLSPSRQKCLIIKRRT